MVVSKKTLAGSSVGSHPVRTNGPKAVHTAGSVVTNSGVFAHLVQFVWAALKAVSGTLVKTKQPSQDCLENEGLGLLPSEL